jgi:CzcA family heavy metal efflux pump
MIRALIAGCLRGRWWVAIAAVFLLVFGTEAARRSPVDAFPEFAPPLVEVQTEAPGLSSLEVENLVTTPLENLLTGVPFATTVRSRSVLGLSSVVVLFEPGTDLWVARQQIQERLASANLLLPASARTPTLLAPVSSTGRILKIGLTSATLSQADLTDWVNWIVRPRLLAIAGVAQVAIWGGREREYTIELDPTRLDVAGVGFDEAVRALRGATLPEPGGYLDGPLQRLPVQHVAPATTPAELEELPIATRAGATIRVRDVAQVVDGFPPPIGDAVVNDRLGLLLIVVKQPWGNTLAITEQVDAALAALAPALPGVEIDAAIFRPASFIQRSIGNLEKALAVGCALVVAVLFLLLWSWRAAAISALAIPLSLGVAVLVLRAADVTLNTMTLAGLVIALGEVVDDAIIDVENIVRRLRENRLRASPRPALHVALEASLEVRSAVVYATAVVILVFLPVWFLGGVAGAFFRPLALAYALGVGASLLVALTVTPALSLLLLPAGLGHERRSPLLGWLERRLERVLPLVLARPKRVLGLGGALVAAALGSALLLAGALLPEFKESDFLMHWVAQPGTSLPALTRTALRVSRELRAIPGVSSFGSHLGRAQAADEIVGQNFAELWIHVDPEVDHERAQEQVKATIAPYVGLRRDVETYLRERVDEVITGTTGAIVVRVFGPDWLALRQGADALAQKLRALSGVTSARVEQQALVPELEVAVRPEAAALGFLPGDVRRAVGLLVRGEQVGEIVRRGRSVPVVVRGPQSVREEPSALRETLLVSSSGSRARLNDVASLAVTPTPNALPHEGGLRRIDVSLAVAGDLGAVARAVEKAVREVQLPPAHHAEVLGEWRERARASTRLWRFAALSLFLVVLVLYADLQSWRRTALVAGSLLFALVGGVLGVWLSGGVLSLGSLVGLVTVLGIASRNGILLISHYRQLEAAGVAPGHGLILRGTVERLGPIVMTALATGLALVPLVARGDQPGHEIEHPMAVVILAGLVSSTVLNLFVMPALYLRWGASDHAHSGGG